MTDLPDYQRQEYARQARFRRQHVDRAAWGSERPFLLAPGEEESGLFPSLRGPDGAVQFFEDRAISWWHSDRWDPEGGARPSRNLLSSQVACVNFFMPLASHPQALLAILKSICADVVEVLPIDHEGRQPFVEFEWSGEQTALEPGPMTRGKHCTSIDALIRARTSRGVTLFLFEWKYTEANREPGEDGRNAERIRRYAELHSRCGLFRLPIEHLLFEPVYQIVRSVSWELAASSKVSWAAPTQ